MPEIKAPEMPNAPSFVTVMVTTAARRALRDALAKRYGGDMYGKMIPEATAAIEAHAAKLLAEAEG